MRLDRDDNTVRCCKRIYRYHSKRRHAVNENIIKTVSDPVHIPFEHTFSVHYPDKAHFHGRKLKIRREKVHSLLRLHNTLHRIEILFINRLSHHGRYRYFKLVRPVKAQTGRKVRLRIKVYKKDSFTFHRKRNPQICGSRCFADSSFLVAD